MLQMILQYIRDAFDHELFDINYEVHQEWRASRDPDGPEYETMQGLLKNTQEIEFRIVRSVPGPLVALGPITCK